ncbi:proteobacterial dedicated sortase system histidine kinase [Pseudoalteromonas sp. Scap03]|uniref:proteobacterial dedicated sortase system histidine kinase n=1 Tax=unclassified Pseudoalteromonas TaxID=194690 RepID=UPI0015BEB8CC|nr:MULTISPECIES: proteobacterial dedicated sortase system histidine kinase [unclassified Pseudoalteromonas]NWL14236.1 proteobacterial dedicated sortase system histidine kinase [Pseudoalteromonas sp. Scap03]QLE82254.1 proteobacterial dedicated sortase system histidine kinase [Pseudoalteromonas sp. Scap25]QLE90196.1 proteobacterial dedicated sortase system histidine kinase [Pseudoalteromonas sp. Scap06]
MLRFGLRSKFILLSCFLFLLPWLGYEYVWEMEKFLRQGQEKTLVGTTRALATALHERPALFDEQTNFLDQVVKGRDLYAYNLKSPIQLDGKLSDWDAYQSLFWLYDKRYLQTANDNHQLNNLSFSHMVGKFDNYLYAVFKVTDDTVIYRAKNSLSITNNDYVKIGLKNPDGQFNTYIIAPRQDGWVNAFDANSKMPFTKIQGFFKKTETGYNLELRFPLSMLGNKLGFAIADVDSKQPNQTPSIMSTSNLNNPNDLGSVLVPSPEINRILKGMGHSGSRIWVVDNHHRVLAQSGSIQNADGVWADGLKNQAPKTAWQRFEQAYLHPLYYKILTRPEDEFIDTLHDVASMQGAHLAKALKGQPASSWRLTPDNKAVILSAAYPIWIEDKVIGAVIAEETTNGVRTLRNKSLEKLFNVILAVMLIGTVTLFFFASRISSRIRRLRDTAEQAIDAQGRVTGHINYSDANDEIGDLSRSFSNIVSRLGGYTDYLENMSSRLSHELRTPVAVVRSSLENLQSLQQSELSQKYLERASEGVERLGKIITTMSEATRLEQSIQSNEPEQFDLQKVISGCMQGYQLTYTNQLFTLNICQSTLPMQGAPEFIAQLLDKLINNALEFSEANTAIEVSLKQNENKATLTVSNTGTLLPEGLTEHIFDSMVSVRSQQMQQQPHLGLGLYIVRLVCDYHKGTVTAHNNEQGNGVVFTVSLPLNN